MSGKQWRLRTRAAVFAVVVVAALLIDQTTKLWALSALGDGSTKPLVPGIVSLTLIRNPGASLGMGSSLTWLIALLAFAACVALIVIMMRTTSMYWTLCAALAFAGAAGNLIDRVVYATGFLNGEVVDFLNYGWSIGNMADIFLMVAGIAIVVLVMVGVPIASRKAVDGGDPARIDDGGPSEPAAR